MRWLLKEILYIDIDQVSTVNQLIINNSQKIINHITSDVKHDSPTNKFKTYFFHPIPA